MSPREVTEQFHSGIKGAFTNLLQPAFVGLILVKLATPALRDSTHLFNSQLTLFLIWIAIAVTIVCCRYAKVTVSADEVEVYSPLRVKKVFQRSRYTFSHRIQRRTVKNIPVWTTRILVAYNDKQGVETPLPNFSGHAFSRLIAKLRQAPPPESVPPEPNVEFIIPKERMLAEYWRSMRRWSALAAVVFVVYFGTVMLLEADKASILRAALLAAICTAVVSVIPAIFIVRGYYQRLAIPGGVRLSDGQLLIDTSGYPLSSIQRITATTPNAAAAAFAGLRIMRIDTERETLHFCFGMRVAQGVLRTRFDDYEKLCQTLEQIAVGRNFEFMYDL